MGYIDKKIAIQNLANENQFNKIKDRFLHDNKNIIETIEDYVELNDVDGIFRIVNNIKSQSLYIGSQVLYDDCENIILQIEKNGTLSAPLLECFIDTLQMVLKELELI